MRTAGATRVCSLGVVLVWLAGCASDRERQAFVENGRVGRVSYMRSGRPVTRESLPAIDDTSGLSDYLTYAALGNPGLEAAFNRWKAALERVPQVRSLPDPRFTYRYFIQEVETRVGPQQQSFALAQTFPWLGKLALRGDVALAEAAAARQRYEAEKLRLFYRVKDAYYEYYYLARAIAVIREQRDLLTYLEQVARTRYRAAASRHPDVIRAQVELGKLDDRLRAAVALRGPVVARLNAAMGRPVQSPLPWPKSVPHETVGATDGEILAWLREASPELKAMAHEAAKEKHGIELAKTDYLPDVTLGVELIDTDQAIAHRTPDSGKDPVVATVSVNVPIWFEKYRAHEREARARHLAALKAKADRENTLSAEVKMVLYKFRDADRKIDLYRHTLVPKARQSLRATQQAFRAGQAGFLDVMDAERVLLEFELSYERALANHAQRLAELDMLVGRSVPRGQTRHTIDAAATQSRQEK